MWKSVFYKEWLKTRWFLIGYAILGILGIGYIYLMVQHNIKFAGAKSYWYSILFMGQSYFSQFKYIPLVGGVAVAVSQYFPETVDKRIKLIFHLPLNENKIILMMHFFGTVCLAMVYLFHFALMVILSGIFFPSEMVADMIVSVLPWFLAGLTAYFFIALVVLEPIWKFRVIYTLVGVFFISLYLKHAAIGAYVTSNLSLTVLTLLLSITLLFSAYRFRKGEM